MGVFNSVFVKCPYCNEENEEQFKPGLMDSYDFPKDAETMPLNYVRAINEKEWECCSCGKKFKTKVDIVIEISNARVE